MSVACDADAKGASVCDEGTFRFPKECCLQPFSFSSPKSSQEGVAFPLTAGNTFPNEVRSTPNSGYFATRYACNAPALRAPPL